MIIELAMAIIRHPTSRLPMGRRQANHQLLTVTFAMIHKRSYDCQACKHIATGTKHDNCHRLHALTLSPPKIRGAPRRPNRAQPARSK